MIFKLSYVNSNLALTLGYLNPALNNSALVSTQGGFVSPRELTDYHNKSFICMTIDDYIQLQYRNNNNKKQKQKQKEQ